MFTHYNKSVTFTPPHPTVLERYDHTPALQQERDIHPASSNYTRAVQLHLEHDRIRRHHAHSPALRHSSRATTPPQEKPRTTFPSPASPNVLCQQRQTSLMFNPQAISQHALPTRASPSRWPGALRHGNLRCPCSHDEPPPSRQASSHTPATLLLPPGQQSLKTALSQPNQPILQSRRNVNSTCQPVPVPYTHPRFPILRPRRPPDPTYKPPTHPHIHPSTQYHQSTRCTRKRAKPRAPSPAWNSPRP